MRPLGVSPRTVLELAREAREGSGQPRSIAVVGPLAPQLARELAAGGDSSRLRVGDGLAAASAVVLVLAGEPSPEQLALLRRIDVAGVPCVAVQTGPASSAVPYVLPHQIVDCEPGHGFPIDRIAAALAEALGDDAQALAARLPVLRAAVERTITLRTAVAAAGVVVASRGESPALPALAVLQARMLRALAVTRGTPQPETPQQVATTVAAELGGALGAGLAARTLVRRLPAGGRTVGTVVAAAVTYALATARRRR